MQIVIELSDETYDKIINPNNWYDPNSAIKDIVKAVENGTPLPKGHGRLIDAAVLPQEDKDIVVKSILKPGTIAYAGAITLQEYINSLPTIIEADMKEVEE